MADVIMTLSEREPLAPKADFGFEIDFVRDAGPASRVFAATHQFIKACEALDAELVQLVDSSIQTVLVLEDIESGSIKTWLRSILSSTEDDALKKLDWKPLVGAYLVRAKYAVIRWVDKDAKGQSLSELRGEIQQIALETDVRRLPAYAPPSFPALIEAAKSFQAVKDHLISGDRAKLLTYEGELEMNLSVRLSLENIEALAVARRMVAPPHQLILPVKRPDYLGDSKWELRHGKRNISARIEDTAWLRRFQQREIDVRPGDALLCMVVTEVQYGHDNELIAETFAVVEVLDVLVSGASTGELPFDGDQKKA